MGPEGDYSRVADDQLDAIERDDPDLYRAVLSVCEAIFDNRGHVRSQSSAITTEAGIVMVSAVPGHPQKVFWSTSGPRIEAVFRYEFKTR